MRIAFFHKTKRRTRTTRYIAGALRRAGHDVLSVRERRYRPFVGRRLSASMTLRSVRRFSPDLVLVHSADASREVIEALAASYRTALFTPDCWVEPLPAAPLALARAVDIVLTVARGQIPVFLEAGAKAAAYLAEALEPSVHYPVPHPGRVWEADVAFIGKAFAESEKHAPRRDLVALVSKSFDLKVHGSGWEALGIEPTREDVYSADYRKVVAGAKIVLGRDWRTDCAWYFSNRTWFTLGCGGFLLTNHVPRLDDIFENHRHLVWYESPGECLELIAHYLARPEERARIARAGHDFALAHRTYDHFARDLVDIVEGRKPAFPPRRVLTDGTRPGG